MRHRGWIHISSRIYTVYQSRAVDFDSFFNVKTSPDLLFLTWKSCMWHISHIKVPQEMWPTVWKSCMCQIMSHTTYAYSKKILKGLYVTWKCHIQHLHIMCSGCMLHKFTYNFFKCYNIGSVVHIQPLKWCLGLRYCLAVFTQDRADLSDYYGVKNPFWPKCNIQRFHSTPSICK